MMPDPAFLLLDRKAPQRSSKRLLYICVSFGFVLRLVLLFITFGSNDQLIWQRIGALVCKIGLMPTYASSRMMTHPLPPSLWAALVYKAMGAARFAPVFKLPSLATDAAVVWLLARGSRGCGPAIAFALSPIAIVQSGFNGSTDSIYVGLSFVSAYLLVERRFFAAGVALGAAINIKLLPLLLVPLAFSFCRRWREAWHLGAALLCWILPNIPLLFHPDVIQRNMAQYISYLDHWGVVLCIELFGKVLNQTAAASDAIDQYRTFSRLIIVAAVLGLAALSYPGRRWKPFELFFLGYTIFLLFTPGFGIQYCLLPISFLAAVNWRLAWLYNLLAGAFVIGDYGLNIIHWRPLESSIATMLSDPLAYLGLGVWCLLAIIAGAWVLPRFQWRRPSSPEMAA